MEVKYMTEQEIRAGYDRDDMDIINGVINGSIQVGEQQQTAAPQETQPEPVQQVQTPDAPPTVQVDDEKERLKKLVEAREAQLSEERARLEQERLNKEKELQSKLEEERKAKEELSNRLKEIEDKLAAASTGAQPQEDDAVLASDYSRNTRQMLEELKKTQGAGNPVIKDIEERLRKFEAAEEQRILENENRIKREQAEAAERKMFDEISSLQKEVPVLATKKSFKELTDEYRKFRNDIGWVVGAKKDEEIDRAAFRYFDPVLGEDIRKKAAERGITAPEEADKFLHIAELIDFKNGYEYDSTTNSFKNITDSFGNPVRYRSLEEAYRIKNYSNELSEAKKRAALEFAQKLEPVQQSRPSIPNSDTVATQGSLTEEQISQLINMEPKEYINDPQKLQMVKQAYAIAGVDMPSYRGRRY